MKKLIITSDQSRFWIKIDLGSISVGIKSFYKAIKFPSFNFYIEASAKRIIDVLCDRLGSQDKQAFRLIIWMMGSCCVAKFLIEITEKLLLI